MELGKLYRFSEFGIYRYLRTTKELGQETSMVWIERTDGSVMTTDIHSLYVVVLEINSLPHQLSEKKAKVLLPDATTGLIGVREDEWEIIISPTVV